MAFLTYPILRGAIRGSSTSAGIWGMCTFVLMVQNAATSTCWKALPWAVLPWTCHTAGSEGGQAPKPYTSSPQAGQLMVFVLLSEPRKAFCYTQCYSQRQTIKHSPYIPAKKCLKDSALLLNNYSFYLKSIMSFIYLVANIYIFMSGKNINGQASPGGCDFLVQIFFGTRQHINGYMEGRAGICMCV